LSCLPTDDAIMIPRSRLAAALVVLTTALAAMDDEVVFADAQVTSDEVQEALDAVELGNVDASTIGTLRRFSEQHPGEIYGHIALSKALTVGMERERVDEAMASLRTAYSLAPGVSHIAGTLGSLAHLHGRKKEAASTYRTALALTPAEPELYFQLGLALQTGDDPDYEPTDERDDASTAAWKSAIDLEPQMWKAYSHLATRLAQANSGRRDEAIGYARAAVALNSSETVTHEALGVALFHGKLSQELSPEERAEAAGALREGLRLRHGVLEENRRAHKKKTIPAEEKDFLARDYYMLSQVLGTSPEATGESELWSEAVSHMQIAVKLMPKRYAKQAETLKQYEKQKAVEAGKVDYMSTMPGKTQEEKLRALRERDPETFAKAAATLQQQETKRLQEDEDAAVAAEEAAEAEAAAGKPRKPRVPKYTRDEVPDAEDGPKLRPLGGGEFGTEPERKARGPAAPARAGGKAAGGKAAGGKAGRRRSSSKFNADGTPRRDEL